MNRQPQGGAYKLSPITVISVTMENSEESKKMFIVESERIINLGYFFI